MRRPALRNVRDSVRCVLAAMTQVLDSKGVTEMSAFKNRTNRARKRRQCHAPFGGALTEYVGDVPAPCRTSST